jgi:hypothetical protein
MLFEESAHIFTDFTQSVMECLFGNDTEMILLGDLVPAVYVHWLANNFSNRQGFFESSLLEVHHVFTILCISPNIPVYLDIVTRLWAGWSSVQFLIGTGDFSLV